MGKHTPETRSYHPVLYDHLSQCLSILHYPLQPTLHHTTIYSAPTFCIFASYFSYLTFTHVLFLAISCHWCILCTAHPVGYVGPFPTPPPCLHMWSGLALSVGEGGRCGLHSELCVAHLPPQQRVDSHHCYPGTLSCRGTPACHQAQCR